MGETEIQAHIRAALSKDGRVRMFRNNVGQTPSLCSECKKKTCSKCRAKFLTPVRYGLGTGSSDLVGYVVNTGRFICMEIKTDKGKPSDEQTLWIDMVNREGGIARIIRSVDEALQFVDEVCKS